MKPAELKKHATMVCTILAWQFGDDLEAREEVLEACISATRKAAADRKWLDHADR